MKVLVRLYNLIRNEDNFRRFLLVLILLLGAILRFHDLTLQSMWTDEIITMNYAEPSKSFSEILSIHRPGGDPHPPLFSLSIHVWFKIFGYSDFSARLFTAIGGVGGIIAVYFLGCAVRNKQTGLIAAFLVAINYFCIYYSQEVRDYIFAFLFSSLSFAYLVKALREPSFRSGAYYALATLLLLYTHYYSLFILVSQVTIISIFLIASKINLTFLKVFCFSGLIILIGYAPWLPITLSITKITTFWMSKPEPDFMLTYFSAYFGNQPFLVTLFGALLVVYFIGVCFNDTKEPFSKVIPFSFTVSSFTILMVWILLSYLIPYVRSLVVFPMLGDRYTIVTLPAILVILAIAIDLIRSSIIKVVILSAVFVISIFGLIFEMKYYQSPTKEQWREMVQFVSQNNKDDYPIITNYGWYQEYYFHQFAQHPTYWESPSASDSLVKYNPKGVWITAAHDVRVIAPEVNPYIGSTFKLVKEFNGIQAKAKFYGNPEYQPLLHGAHKVSQDSIYILYYFANLTSDSITLDAGKYELILNASGTFYGLTFPRIKIYLNDIVMRQVNLIEEVTTYTLDFSVSGKPQKSVVRVEYYDDPSLPVGERNVYISSLFIDRKE